MSTLAATFARANRVTTAIQRGAHSPRTTLQCLSEHHYAVWPAWRNPSMTVKLHPFQTPNFVRMDTPARPREEGFNPAPSFPLAEVDAITLAAMCDEFRAEVFRKAGKADPAAAK